MMSRIKHQFVVPLLLVLVFPTCALAQGAAAGSQPAAASAAPPPCGASSTSAAAKSVRYINPEAMFEASSYSKAAVLPPGARMVLISGMIPVNKLYAVQGSDLKGQVMAALENLCQAMREAGVGRNDIVRLGISYVHRDAADPFVIAEMMSAFFARDTMPATTMVGVSFLISDNIRFQIEATAVVDK